MFSLDKKYFFVFLFSLLFSVLLIFQTTFLITDAKTLTLTHIQPPTHGEHKVHEYFAERLKELTGGELEVLIYHSMQLGDERESMDMLSRGTIDFSRFSSMIMTSISEIYQVLNLPFLFASREECMKFVRSKMFNELIEPELKKHGLKTLSYYYASPRHIYTNKPVYSLSDFKSVKIRLPETRAMLEVFSALGCIPTPISYSELKTALTTGIVDGAEGPPLSYIVNEFYQEAPYLLTRSHMEQTQVFMVSQKTWDELSSSLQAAVQQAANEASIKMEEMFIEETVNSLQRAEELNFKLIEPTDWEEWGKIAQREHYKIAESLPSDTVKLIDWLIEQRKK